MELRLGIQMIWVGLIESHESMELVKEIRRGKQRDGRVEFDIA